MDLAWCEFGKIETFVALQVSAQ
uniref:Uncharacterized protein n=1 Tax=Arundo donax TaxID=35708 RepID=A0A0A9GU36_ARUDO